MVKVAILTSRGMNFLNEEMIRPEHTKTKITATPIENPFIAELVTAKVGHIPRS